MDIITKAEPIEVAVRDIDTITAEIRTLTNQFINTTLAYVVEIGRRLVEAKSLLDHGAWGKWLAENTQFSQSRANDYMKLFREYGDSQITLFGAVLNSQTSANLNVSQALSLLALPADEREEFIAENDVENMSVRELEKAIKEKKAAEEERDRALKDLDYVDRENDEYRQREKELEAKIDELTDENENLSAVVSAVEVERKKSEDAQKELLEARAALDKAKEAEKKAKAKLKELKENPEIAPEVMERITAEAEKNAAEKQQAEAEKLLASANEKIDAANKARKSAEAEAEAASRRIEELEKKIKTLSPDFLSFKSAFDGANEAISRMLGAFKTLEKSSPELAEKMREPVKKLKEGISV